MWCTSAPTTISHRNYHAGKRRYEVLSWASEKDGRYIIEDDYDSEFRISGKPIPTLFSIDECEKSFT